MTSPTLSDILANEFLLRDYAAAHIDEIEKGLVVLKKEYVMENRREHGGAGGRADILAIDELDHIVAVEVKQSDKTARETLHELTKYISLLIERDRVPRAMIRCIVISTKWHELDLPLSYFCLNLGIPVIAIEPVISGGKIVFHERPLKEVSLLPQFSPEFSIFCYENESTFEQHLAHMTSRAKALPFARLAIATFKITDSIDGVLLRAVVCMWRLREEDYDLLEQITGNSIGYLFPYAFPGWEAECDCLVWLTTDGNPPGPIFISAELERGTPEKVDNFIKNDMFLNMYRIGDWPKVEFINTPQRILGQLKAVTSLAGVERTNRYHYQVSASPRIRSSWNDALTGFFNFIGHIPEWELPAKEFIKELVIDDKVTVHFSAFDKNHFFYALHQCTAEIGVGLSSFSMVLNFDNGKIAALMGSWLWDGSRAFLDAESEMKKVFESVGLCAFMTFNAVNKTRYDDAYRNHGFYPIVHELVDFKDDKPVFDVLEPEIRSQMSLDDFVLENKEYVQEVSTVLCQNGSIPTSPKGHGSIALMYP